MADISQVTLLDGATYDLKDATARSLLNGHSINADVPSTAKFTDTQADWNETDTTASSYIANKPSVHTIYLASTTPVSPTNGDLWFKITS